MTSPLLPPLALSVRQPWAWAIIHAGKDIENRSAGSIRAGRIDCRSICIHAASGMREIEYDWAVWRLAQDGVSLPRPDALIRSAIIGTVNVVEIVSKSDSPWFGGKSPDARGLRLAKPVPIEPIPSKGALGYFAWEASGEILPAKPWMTRWKRPNNDDRTLDLFPSDPVQFLSPPERPFGRKSK